MFEEINKGIIAYVQSTAPEVHVTQICEHMSDREYQALVFGWCLAKGIEYPEDCSKETNWKV